MKNTEKYSFFNNIKYTNLVKDKHKDVKTEEYKLWYKGDINKILEFYKTNRDRMYNTNTMYYTPSFMRLAPVGNSSDVGGATQLNNFTIYHNPVANIISRAMSNLLFSTEPTFSFSTRNKNRTKDIENKFYLIQKENDLGSLLQKSSEYESYSGAIAFKPIIDPDFSDVPILQVYAKEDFILNKKYDKVISIVFIDRYKEKKDNYALLSEYGRGYIKYKLINEIDGREIPLNTLNETQNLTDLTIVDEDGELIPDLLAVYKENKPDCRSDYENSIDDFNAIDEVYSNMMNFIRKTAPKRVVSESSLKKVINDGNEITIIPSVYDSDIVIKYDNNTGQQEETNELQTIQDINNTIQGYLSAMGEILKNVARTVGLSIKTVAGEDLSGANASADALSIRENIDYRTRDNKKIGWNETLIKLAKVLLILTDIEVYDNYIVTKDVEDIEINIEFYNPSTPTFEQTAAEVRDLIDAGLIDPLNGLMRLWFETGIKSETEVLEMYNKLQGIEEEKQSVVEELIENQEPTEEETETEEDNEEESQEEVE